MCSDKKCFLSKSCCTYYLTLPLNSSYIIDYLGFSHLPHIMNGYEVMNCPFYAPCVPDGNCRYCGLTATKHRKYYLYSHFAMKIQRVYLRYRFRTKVIPMLQIRNPFKKVSIRGEFFFPFLYKRFYKNGYRDYQEERINKLISEFFIS